MSARLSRPRIYAVTAALVAAGTYMGAMVSASAQDAAAPVAAAAVDGSTTAAVPAPAKPAAAAAKKASSKTAAAASPTTATAGNKASSKSGAAPSKDGAAAPKAKGGNQSIVALINDEPITVYEVEQRAAFIAMSSGGGGDMRGKAEARWKQIIKDPSTSSKFQELLKAKNVQTKEEAQKLQTTYIKGLQANMVEQLRREVRSSAVAGSRTKAQDELIDEKIKLQEAKKMTAVASDEDVSVLIRSIAERNKMTEDQFGQHMKGMGVDIGTMRSRFRAEISWREVVRRRFGSQVAVTGKDVDKLVANNPGADEDVELSLQRISLFTPPKADQKLLAQRLGEAQAMAAKFTTCADFKTLATQVGGARFEDLGSRRPSTIPEPTRTMLLNTQDGNMLPPAVGGGGVELWAVCGRKTVSANSEKRESAENELKVKEFEILAKKHLQDLRQDAAIEYR